MDRTELERRTKMFALGVIRSVGRWRRDAASDTIGRQLIRAATAIGANYREAGRAESRDDFIHKIAIVEKEAAETYYWLDLAADAQLGAPDELAGLLEECDELLAIFTAAGRTAKQNRPVRPIRSRH